jgi:hypothetical protein
LIGYYLFEYEQKGEARAEYGDKLYDKIAAELKRKKLKGVSKRNLYLFKDFYSIYPQPAELLLSSLKGFDLQLDMPIVQTLSAQFEVNQYSSSSNLLLQ